MGVSAAEVGEATGLSTTTITRIELGDVEPKLATAVRILAWTDATAKKFRVPVAARVRPADLLQVGRNVV